MHPTGKLAAELPSLGRHPGDVLFRRHQREDGSHYGIARDDTCVEYTAEEVKVLEVKLDELGRRIAAIFDFEASDPECLPDSHLVCIGTFERGGLRYPAYLLITADDNQYTSALISTLAGTLPAVVFVPTPRRMASSLRSKLSAQQLVIIALSDVLAIHDDVWVPIRLPDQLMPAAIARAEGKLPKADGVYPPNKIVWRGEEHVCNLSRREMIFLEHGLLHDSVEVATLMHRRNGLLWKEHFLNTKVSRNKVSLFLSRLNIKLLDATPPLKITFSLMRGSNTVIRSTPHGGSASSSLS